METTAEKTRYGTYERQRLLRILVDLMQGRRDMTWSKLAQDISQWRRVHFQRQCFYRLRNPEKHGPLSDENVEYIVSWVEAHCDADIRERLRPQAIFGEMGKTARDYYFHISAENVLEEWDEQLLRRFAGVYFCVPDSDKNSLLPMPIVRQWLETKGNYKREPRGRSLDLNAYIQKRSILILQYTHSFHYYAAEFPLSILFPNEVYSGDLMMVCEGVGIVSSNSIHIQMRDCLSRVPKTISMVIKPKPDAFYKHPHGLSFYIGSDKKGIVEHWSRLTDEALEWLKQEYALTLDNDMFFHGTSQYSWSPLPSMASAIAWNQADGCVFHPKPNDFLRHKDLHFLYPEINNDELIEKIIDNPLSIGELL